MWRNCRRGRSLLRTEGLGEIDEKKLQNIVGLKGQGNKDYWDVALKTLSSGIFQSIGSDFWARVAADEKDGHQSAEEGERGCAAHDPAVGYDEAFAIGLPGRCS